MPTTAVSANGSGSGNGNGSTGGGTGTGANNVPLGTTNPTPADQPPSAFIKIGATASAAPNFAVNSYLVADLESGTIFASKNPDGRWPTASLTKLMTATLVEDYFSTSTDITITEPMFAVDPVDETTLVVNGTYSAQDLLPVMLLPSSNVAAQAFADFYGYSSFISDMNARAAAWGMTNTYFNDPSGLSASDESTADDFLKLAQVIYRQYPQIFAITRTPQVTITEKNSGKAILVKSINNYAGLANFVGGKTGNTPQANGNLLSVFNYDGHPLFIVVLGADDGASGLNAAFSDTNTLYNWFKAHYE
jgi:serine-type D-Ala-D-Ala endopeptidase (penicillin-binding protein 7)